ncbi:MAG: methyltransferase domain-containing protein [Acidobacteriota bacterium]
MAWYKEWFGQEYLELYAHRDQGEAERHARFVVEHLRGPRPRRVLDLACGAGRHAAALRRQGLDVIGVDLSIALLAHGGDRRSVCGDMRALPLRAERFDWVLNFFTSFGYFDRERENFRVLEELWRVLTPGGRFLIDLFNAHRVVDELKPRERQTIGGREVLIERWYDPETRRVNKRIRLQSAGRGAETFVESVRAYTRDEVTIGARWAGLEVDALYGNFLGEPYRRDSDRLIVVGHKTQS